MLSTTGFGAAGATITVIAARLETRFGAAARFVTVLWAAWTLVAFTIAMHSGWWRAAAVVAGAMIAVVALIVLEMIARAVVIIVAEVTFTRRGATEIFWVAVFGAALAG